jgi:hypothetical protein
MGGKKMRKTALIVGLIMLISVFAVTTSMAAAPNQVTLSLNSGYAYTWGELELEYKNSNYATGATLGYGNTNLELGVFARYYIPLNPISSEVNWNLFITVTPSLLIRPTYSPIVGFGLKIGPGIDLRWRQLRLAVECGYRWSTYYSHGFYTKAGIGFIF